MCRHIGYLGPPTSAGALVLEPPHSLVVQSYAPLDMRGGGRINADGFGIGWFSEDGAAVSRYRRAVPIWADASLPALAGTIRSRCLVAAVRSATVGMPIIETACAPFTDGEWLFSHNGYVAGWPGSVASLASTLSSEALLTLEAPTDSALLWALVRRRLGAGAPPAEAVRSVVLDVEAAAPGSRLNLLLANPSVIVATTVVHALSLRADGDAVLVSSEPLDAGSDWKSVPDRQLVVATIDDVRIEPIEG